MGDGIVDNTSVQRHDLIQDSEFGVLREFQVHATHDGAQLGLALWTDDVLSLCLDPYPVSNPVL